MLTPVVLQEAQVQELVSPVAAATAGYELTVDLVHRRVARRGRVSRPGFAMDEYRREMLLKGLDEIGKTLLEEPRIAAFERRRAALAAERRV